MKRFRATCKPLFFAVILAMSAEMVSGDVYRVGTNFWNLGWGTTWSDCFTSTNINWASVTNPWVPQFLTDIAVYNGPLRFMDWCLPNDSTIVNWSGRTLKTDNQYTATSGSHQKALAYEWMIDLANRTNRDMWICLPFMTVPDYWTQLATLIKSNLNPNLKVYVEYSNETWNGGEVSNGYTINQGEALGLPGSNGWYQGFAFSLWQTTKIWKAFQDVWGDSAMGTRVMRTFAFSGNFDIADKAYLNVVVNGGTKWNPDNQKADIFAVAPYVGPNDDSAGGGVLDGAEANIAARFRACVIWNYNHYILPAVAIAKKYNVPLCTYEAGQQLTTNADVWSSNPAIDSEYTFMFNLWKSAGFSFVTHYTHTGSYSFGGAWGAKPTTSATMAQSPKYQAIVDWLKANPTSVTSPRDGKSGLSAGAVPAFSAMIGSHGALTVSGLDKYNPSEVRVVGLSGRIVYEKSLPGSALGQLSIGGLSNGMYLLQVINRTKTVTQKVVVGY